MDLNFISLIKAHKLSGALLLLLLLLPTHPPKRYMVLLQFITRYYSLLYGSLLGPLSQEKHLPFLHLEEEEEEDLVMDLLMVSGVLE